MPLPKPAMDLWGTGLRQALPAPFLETGTGSLRLGMLGKAVRGEPWLGAIGVAYALIALGAGVVLERRALVGVSLYASQFGALLVLYPCATVLCARLAAMGTSTSLGHASGAAAWRAARRGRFDAATTLEFVWAGSCVTLIMASFTALKLMIPTVRPFGWDRELMRLDAALHFGRQPWEWLFPLFSAEWATRFVDFVYSSLWFQVVLGVFAWQVWRVRSPERSRFLLAYVAIWVVLGSLAAAAFSSAGPAYYGMITGARDPYRPLLGHLRAIHERSPLVSVQVQDWLWSTFQSGGSSAGGGIAAMPSLHVAMAELCAVVGRAQSPRLGAAMTAFSMLTLAGSVYLGPHYAVDGYASIAP